MPVRSVRPRPPAPEAPREEVRKKIGFNFRSDEWGRIKAAAQKARKPPRAYCRDALLDVADGKLVPPEDARAADPVAAASPTAADVRTAALDLLTIAKKLLGE